MDTGRRSRHRRKYCEHCGEELLYSAYPSHRRLYYGASEQRWLQQSRTTMTLLVLTCLTFLGTMKKLPLVLTKASVNYLHIIDCKILHFIYLTQQCNVQFEYVCCVIISYSYALSACLLSSNVHHVSGHPYVIIFSFTCVCRVLLRTCTSIYTSKIIIKYLLNS